MFAFIKRQIWRQDWYISIERNEKEIKLVGKNPFLVEVSNEGEPIGKNVRRWSTKMGTRYMAHLDSCKSNFAELDPRSMENFIQKMENSFDIVGG